MNTLPANRVQAIQNRVKRQTIAKLNRIVPNVPASQANQLGFTTGTSGFSFPWLDRVYELYAQYTTNEAQREALEAQIEIAKRQQELQLLQAQQDVQRQYTTGMGGDNTLLIAAGLGLVLLLAFVPGRRR